MFKRFLFQTLSSFTGAIIALILGGVTMILVIGGIVGSFSGGSSEKTAEVKPGCILKLDLEGEINECELPFSPSLSMLTGGDMESSQTLSDIRHALKEAADNKDIVAVYLKCGDLSAGPVTIDAIRNELLQFKKTTGGKKKIYAYGGNYTQGCYLISTAADSVFMNPQGMMALRGFSIPNFYFKGLLDKFGVSFQIAKVGTYKSAVEPYIMDHMSEPARAQMDTLLTNFWDYTLAEISKQRKGLSAEKINELVNKDNIMYAASSLSVKSGLVNGVIYEREMDAKLARAAKCDVEKLNLVDVATVVKNAKPVEKSYDAKNQIAILYACGDIQDGDDSQINYEKFVPIILKLAEDKNVKGMVLRVNSPGGSAYGSDQIGEALDYFQSKGKTLAVSMGDYAASGGYWISACADRIFADPMTITGSIGIFGMFPCVEGTMEKLGVNVDLVATNPGANFPSLFKASTDEQMAVLQKYVERGYDEFVTRVAKGRKMKKERVLQIAEGRVWDGMKALQLGLVDQLGGISDAIAYVATKANIKDDYNLAAYPEYEPSFFDMIMSGGVKAADLKTAFSQKDTKIIESYLLNRILSRNPVQARMGEFGVKM